MSRRSGPSRARHGGANGGGSHQVPANGGKEIWIGHRRRELTQNSWNEPLHPLLRRADGKTGQPLRKGAECDDPDAAYELGFSEVGLTIAGQAQHRRDRFGKAAARLHRHPMHCADLSDEIAGRPAITVAQVLKEGLVPDRDVAREVLRIHQDHAGWPMTRWSTFESVTPGMRSRSWIVIHCLGNALSASPTSSSPRAPANHFCAAGSPRAASDSPLRRALSPITCGILADQCASRALSTSAVSERMTLGGEVRRGP